MKNTVISIIMIIAIVIALSWLATIPPGNATQNIGWLSTKIYS